MTYEVSVPESDQPKEGERAILDRLVAMKPARVLDVGPGPGRWGRLLRAEGITVDAVEIWEPYVEDFNLRAIYDTVYVQDARTFDRWVDYDAVIFSDVLEHMPKDDARKMIAVAACTEAAVDGIFLSIPTTDCPQAGEPFGNPYEAHVAQWSHEELVADGWRELHRGLVPSGLATVGTYVKGTVAPRVSIVVTTRNRAVLLAVTLASIREQNYLDTETIVFDDGSTDGSSGVLAAAPWVIPLRCDREGGYRNDPSPVFNAAMGHARGDILIQQSAEVVHLTPVARQLHEATEPGVCAFATVLAGPLSALEGVTRAVKAGHIFPGTEWAGANPRVIDPMGRRPDGGDGVATPPVRVHVGSESVEVYTGEARPVPFFFLGAIHRSDWERSGGYPEGNPYGASDLHFAFRLQRMGVRFKFLGGAIAYHVEHDKR